MDYRGYVGAREDFDRLGASQFFVLVKYGLREHHRVLDFGCGSLRGGRFLMTYLAPGNYYGIEPEKQVLDEMVENELSWAFYQKRKPHITHGKDFQIPPEWPFFDFILAQSILSHTSGKLMEQCLDECRGKVASEGLIFATAVLGEKTDVKKAVREARWYYPDPVTYHPREVEEAVKKAGLWMRWLEWWHPRQRWFVAARNEKFLPSSDLDLEQDGVFRGWR